MKATNVEEKTTCYHCGDPCGEHTAVLDDKHFCCSGCKIVFELLQENNLCTYYELDDQPGIKLEEMFISGKFDILEDDEVVNRLIDFRDEYTVQVTLSIPAIHCTSCVWLLENLHKLADGVLQSRVHFMRKELSITYRPNEISLKKIAEWLTKTGYEPIIQLSDLDEQGNTAKPQRRLWQQLGVAGFAFGNIMLLSFPEYLTGLGIDPNMQFVFGLLSILLALPVLLYSGSDYLRSAWSAIQNRGINLDVPIALGIMALFGRSLYEILSGTGAGYLDSFAGFIFLLLLGKMVQRKTFEHLRFDRDYRSYFPISVLRKEGEQEKAVSVDSIKEGDLLRIRNSEVIPVDSILLTGHANIDYSFVTGESDPVSIEEGEMLYAGGRVAGPSIEISATKKVNNSRLTELWNKKMDQEEHTDAKSGDAQKAYMSDLADRVSPWFTATVIAIALLASGYWLLANPDPGLAANVFTAVLIVACPCALALSGPFTFGNALNILSNNGIFVKNTGALERLSQINTIVFDKTGTLTNQNDTQLEYKGEPLARFQLSAFESLFKHSLHPLSRSILANFNTFHNLATQKKGEFVLANGASSYSKYSGISSAQTTEWQEFSNDDAKKNSSGLDENNTTDTEYQEYAGRGAVLKAGVTYTAGSLAFLQEKGLKMGFQVDDRSTTDGSEVFLGINDTIVGRLTLQQQLRDGAASVIEKLSSTFGVHLLTGDNDSRARFLRPMFPSDSALKFRQSPEQKLTFIQHLKQKGRRVLMIGDGLNDAGAIHAADFGVSLTEKISSFSPACDAIMEASVFSKLDNIIHFCRSSITIIWVSFAISLIYNLTGLVFAVTGQLTPLIAAILMPLSSVSIMIFTTLATKLTAKSHNLSVWK